MDLLIVPFYNILFVYTWNDFSWLIMYDYTVWIVFYDLLALSENDEIKMINQQLSNLTHWGWVTHICIGKLTIIGLDNGLSPCQHQAIIWTNAGILLVWPLGTNFSEMLIEIYTFSFKKMHVKLSSVKRSHLVLASMC